MNISIPFHKADIGEAEAAAVAEVIRSGWLTMGPKTVEFEHAFANYVGAKHAVAVASCTAALHLALEAIGLRAGDEVLIPTTTFTATAEVVAYFQAIPVFTDIDADHLLMDPADAERRVTARTRAIIPVHYGGQPCDLDEIHAIAARHRLHVIEDAAHSLPATYRGKKVGSISDLTAFSFYATKTLCTGEGGMVTTDDDTYAERVRIMRLHGIGRDAWKRYSGEGSWYYEVLEAGYKYNMTDLQAALGLVQLGKCHTMRSARERIATRYDEGFGKLDEVQIPSVKTDRTSAWHLYPLRLRQESTCIGRDELIEKVKQHGIGTSVHFIPLHMHPYYQKTYGYKAGDFPTAEREYQRYLSLPLYSGMTEGEVDYVIKSVTDIVRTSEVRVFATNRRTVRQP